MAFKVTSYLGDPAPKKKATVAPAITAGTVEPPKTAQAPVQPAPAQKPEKTPAPAKPVEVQYAPGFGQLRNSGDGHRQGQLSWSGVSGEGRSAESEDADAKARRDLWSYGMKLSMDRAFDIDRENRAQARKIKSAGWQMTGGHVDYNRVQTSAPLDYAAFLRPFDAPAKTTMPSGTFVGIQNWDQTFHNPDQGKYLASTTKAVLGMESLQKFVTTDKNGVKSFSADAFDKAWDSLSAKQKDEITGSYKRENVTHASASEGNPYQSASMVLDEGRRFAPGLGGNGRSGTIMMTTRDANGNITGGRFHDESKTGDLKLTAATTEKMLGSEQAHNGHLADAMDTLRASLEEKRASEAVETAKGKLAKQEDTNP